MIRLLADENFNNDILRGLRRRVPIADITRVQDTELLGEPDPVLLAWAAQYGYILLSHDVNTMRGYFYERMAANFPVPGLFLVHSATPIGEIIRDLELIILTSEASEWQGLITFLPF